MRSVIAAAVLAVAATGCQVPERAPLAVPTGVEEPGPLEPSEPFGLTMVTLQAPEGGTALAMHVYDAYEPKSRRLGLMHREQLPARTGMIFRMPQDTERGFWMKNTLIPLSIAFFDAEGEVLALRDMPPCEADPCPSYDPGVPYRGALEVNRGMFEEIGLEPGWRVQLPVGLPAPR